MRRIVTSVLAVAMLAFQIAAARAVESAIPRHFGHHIEFAKLQDGSLFPVCAPYSTWAYPSLYVCAPTRMRLKWHMPIDMEYYYRYRQHQS